MKWYNNTVTTTDDIKVFITGEYLEQDAKIHITCWFNHFNDYHEFVYWSTTINMWVHQEILADDIYAKYAKKIAKLENNISKIVHLRIDYHKKCI